jgi:hypothetical protein
MLAAQIWHYWIGVALVGGSVLTLLALIVGYLAKVQAPQYPKNNQQQ